jgi:hypothetical protein
LKRVVKRHFGGWLALEGIGNVKEDFALFRFSIHADLADAARESVGRCHELLGGRGDRAGAGWSWIGDAKGREAEQRKSEPASHGPGEGGAIPVREPSIAAPCAHLMENV